MEILLPEENWRPQKNSQGRRSGEIKSIILETCKSFVMPHGSHLKNEIDMGTARMCPFLSDGYSLPHRKCLLWYCVNFPRSVIHFEESHWFDTNVCSTIHFHVYRLVSHCTVHDKLPFEGKLACSLFPIFPTIATRKKLYTQREPF